MRKKSILLIPDTMAWILGTWSREIMRLKSEAYQFLVFPYMEIMRNEKLFLSVIQDIDIIHCLTQWGFPTIKAILDRNRISNVSLISSVFHVTQISEIREHLDADKIMVICKKYYNEFSSRVDLKEKIFLLYNGVDTEIFSPMDKREAKKKFGNPEGHRTLGFSAKVSSDHDNRKGIDVFLEVLSKIPLYQGEKTRVLITGPGWREIIRRNINDNIKICYYPYLDWTQMPVFYNAVDIFLVTSRAEGGPATLIEAMSCETPVITTPVGMALDFIESGSNGFVVPLDDMNGFLRTILLLYNNRELGLKIGRAGRETVEKDLKWGKTLQNIDDLYRISDKGLKKIDEVRIGSFTELSEKLINREMRMWKTSFRWYSGMVVLGKRLKYSIRKMLKWFFKKFGVIR